MFSRDLIDSPRVPDRGHENDAARLRRLAWIRDNTGEPLTSLDTFDLDPSRVVGNIENLVGSVAVPVGIAGPLYFTGDYATGWIAAPFATTEGALVASATRGARAISLGGGVTTKVLSQRMVRSPRFNFDNVNSAYRFSEWIKQCVPQLAGVIATTSQHAVLVELVPLQIGRSVDLLFNYQTGDASGQNMTTACTWKACHWIEQELHKQPNISLQSFCIESNSAGDKKLSHRTILGGRGTRVTAECRIGADVLENVLKVSSKDLVKAYTITAVGSAMSGGVSLNVNAANAIAALFVATGQDIACVHESGTGILNVEEDGDGIYASLLLPGLAIGTVGGGTSLPQQSDYLSMMGCTGSGTSSRLAEVIAGYALALDLSTMSAVIGGQFASAHERLGRNRPVDWFTESNIGVDFLQRMMNTYGATETVVGVEIVGDRTDASIISELTHRVSTQKLVGIRSIDVTFSGSNEPIELILKSKPLDSEVILATQRLISTVDSQLAHEWSENNLSSGFGNTHTREIEIYLEGGPLSKIMPRMYGVYQDPAREAYLLLMERLGPEVILIDSGSRSDLWSTNQVQTAISGIAAVHGYWYGREDELQKKRWLGPITTSDDRCRSAALWRGLYAQHKREYPELVTDLWIAEIDRWLGSIGQWWRELESMPRTLVHNDFNSRNIALRTVVMGDASPGVDTLVAYDWELATLHVPQRDLVELLAYVLPADASESLVDSYIEFHRNEVSQAAGREIDAQQWRRGYQLALADFVITRLSLYLLVHTAHRLPFIEKVIATVKVMSAIEMANA